MAKIWFTRQGEWPVSKGPAHQLPFSQCTSKLGPLCFLSEISSSPEIKSDDERISRFKDTGYVLVEGGEDELKGSLEWRSGYYVASFPPEEVKKRLQG